MKPNFFILGAPKCGTTSLAYWLSQHPNIFMSPVKEPHYFNTDGFQNITDKSEYENLFKGVESKHCIVGEASTHYVYSNAAIKNILNYVDNPKFLLCIRNPIEMAQSLHKERIYQGKETEIDFRKAWNLCENRKKGFNLPSTVKRSPQRLDYRYLCSLGSVILNIKKIIKPKNLKIIVLDDMKNNREQVYSELLKFLEIENDGRENFPILNKSKKTKYPYVNYLLEKASLVKKAIGFKKSFGIKWIWNKIFTKVEEKPTLDENFKQELIGYYKSEVDTLSNILNRDFSHWLK